MRDHRNQELTQRARDLRARQTKAKGLLWAALRNRKLCGLKFRRQFPIDEFIVDFACIQHDLVVEIDGGYHDYVVGQDASRQKKIESLGWRVVRFANEDVLDDVDAVAVAIA
ncbi:MAG: DNA methyltransferase [Planctomycetaceae bacterium]|nr:DNA methyltransferase [Planctomycetaceae bacterium]